MTSRPEMADSSAEKEGFEFTSGDNLLRGIAHIPSGCDTAIILIHGWGTCRLGPQRYFLKLADLLVQKGCGTIRFDLPGRGESEGNPARINIDDMAEAVTDCVEYIKSEWTGITRIGLGGICSGGNTAILAAGRIDVDFLLLWSTFTFRARKSAAVKAGRTGHFLGVYFRKAFSLSTWKRLFRGALNLKLIFRTLFGHYRDPVRNLKDSAVNAMAQWKDFKGSVLFVYGTKDPEAVDARMVYREFCRINGIRAEFVDIPEATHNFYRPEWGQQLFDASISFIEKQVAEK